MQTTRLRQCRCHLAVFFLFERMNFVKPFEADFGILLCGSANGVAMTANKHQNIRAAICWKQELAIPARTHNDANVLCLPARHMSIEEAKKTIETFLSEEFEGGRHARRVGKISC